MKMELSGPVHTLAADGNEVTGLLCTLNIRMRTRCGLPSAPLISNRGFGFMGSMACSNISANAPSLTTNSISIGVAVSNAITDPLAITEALPLRIAVVVGLTVFEGICMRDESCVARGCNKITIQSSCNTFLFGGSLCGGHVPAPDCAGGVVPGGWREGCLRTGAAIAARRSRAQPSLRVGSANA
jgi:hypothetical protein